MNADLPDVTEFFMPCGDDVIALLSQPALTDAFIRGLLRDRGVFSNQSERVALIEHFVLSYLTTSEYDQILERLTTKEEAFKLRTVTHSFSSDSIPLSSVVPKPSLMNIREIAADPNGNYQIEKAPSFVRLPSGDFLLEYFIRRRNAGRSWIKSQERFPGRVILSQSPDGKKLLVKSFHSAPETKTVNSAIKRWLRNDLKQKQLIKPDSEETISYGDFTNAQRMAFFMKFTQKYPEENFEFERVTDFDFRVDDQFVPPNELRLGWMTGGAVSRSSLRGRALHDLFILREKAAWSFVKLWFIELRFKISTSDFDGWFSLYLEFDGYGHSSSDLSKFQFSLGQISSRRFGSSTERERRAAQDRFDLYVPGFAKEILGK